MYYGIQRLILCALLAAGSAHADILSLVTGHGSMTAEYAAPNEHHNYHQYDVAKRGQFNDPTAAIAVGTIRAFNLAGVLRRDMLVAVDKSLGIVTINEHIAQMILQKNRQEFIASILLLDAPEARVDTFEQYYELASRSLKNSDGGNREFRRLLRRTGNEPDKWIQEMRKYGASADTFRGTFFSSDANYEHVRALVRNGKFHAVVADLGNYEAMYELGQLVQNAGHVVSEFDISNVMDYIESHVYGGKLAGFVASTDLLPHSARSRVLITVFKDFASSDMRLDLATGDQWVYLFPTFHEFMHNGARKKSHIYGHLFDQQLTGNTCASRVAPAQTGL